jgi:ribosomal protein S18 acetylase RimI-like enzyme
VWSALTGPHRGLGEATDRAGRYRPEYAPFAGLRDAGDDRGWADLARLVEPDEAIAVAGPDLRAPAGWTVLNPLDGLQMVATEALQTDADPAAVVLGEADVAELTDLVARTQPGPFRSQTWRMGTYLGLRVEGRLVAMAGERMHLPGWTEISAVCTDPDFRGQGLAARLIRALAAGIRDRGERPMMHVMATNNGAIRLYEHLGFAVRRSMRFLVVQPPVRPAPTAVPLGR